jgi:predicted ribonuclease YlaK
VAEHPAARVVLVTGDVNLQNKADAALLETADTP